MCVLAFKTAFIHIRANTCVCVCMCVCAEIDSAEGPSGVPKVGESIDKHTEKPAKLTETADKPTETPAKLTEPSDKHTETPAKVTEPSDKQHERVEATTEVEDTPDTPGGASVMWWIISLLQLSAFLLAGAIVANNAVPNGGSSHPWGDRLKIDWPSDPKERAAALLKLRHHADVGVGVLGVMCYVLYCITPGSMAEEMAMMCYAIVCAQHAQRGRCVRACVRA